MAADVRAEVQAAALAEVSKQKFSVKKIFFSVTRKIFMHRVTFLIGRKKNTRGEFSKGIPNNFK